MCISKKTLSFLGTFCLGSALAVSPDILVLLGSIWGRTGMAGIIALLWATGIYLIGINQFRHKLFTTDRATAALPAWLIFIRLGVKTLTLGFLATGLLVSSGFAFNEIFLYWFPNFGFAYLLLLLLCGLQFLNRTAIGYCQIGFTLIPIAGLTALSAWSIFVSGGTLTPGTLQMPETGASFISGIFFLPLLLFVGLDLGFSHPGRNDIQTNGSALFWAVICIGSLFILWGLVMLCHVPAQKLAQTTIPHLITARKILGDTGRYIMGFIIIFGSMAAVHAMLTHISGQISGLAEKKILPKKLNRPKTMIILLSIIVGLMMGAGVAGSEYLETYIRITLVLWLFSHILSFLYLKSVHSHKP